MNHASPRLSGSTAGFEGAHCVAPGKLVCTSRNHRTQTIFGRSGFVVEPSIKDFLTLPGHPSRCERVSHTTRRKHASFPRRARNRGHLMDAHSSRGLSAALVIGGLVLIAPPATGMLLDGPPSWRQRGRPRYSAKPGGRLPWRSRCAIRPGGSAPLRSTYSVRPLGRTPLRSTNSARPGGKAPLRST